MVTRSFRGSGKTPGIDERFKNLLMFSGRDCMNLAMLRGRADEMRKSLDQIIMALQIYPERVEWSSALDQFAVLNVQYYNLVSQLRPMLKHWVVHPKVVNQENHQVLPLMMSTRLLPEMEKEEAALLKAPQEQQSASTVEEQYVQLQSEIEDFNTLIDFLTAPRQGSEDSGLLDPKSSLRAQISAPLSKSSAAAMSTLKANATQRGRALKPVGKLHGAELLLASALRGEGLR